MLKTDFVKQVVCPWNYKKIVKVIELSAKVEKKIKGRLEINIISGSKMKEINRIYRGINKSTDVLSFAWQEDKVVPSDYLGQIYISYDQVRQQAKEFSVSIKEEFIRMLVHGLLHLVGYDHYQKKEAQQMFAQQERITTKVLDKI